MFKFGYSNKLVKSKKHLTLEATTTNLYSLLEQIAMKARLRFKRVNNRILVIKEGKKHRKSFGAPVVQMGGIRGIISDEDTGGPIIGVSVGIKGSSKGTATVADFDRYETNGQPWISQVPTPFLGEKSRSWHRQEMSPMNLKQPIREVKAGMTGIL